MARGTNRDNQGTAQLFREKEQAYLPPAQTVDCPVCQVKIGEPCTQPTDTSRKPVRWFHVARINLADGWD